jgi:hypothetical protein
MIDTTTERTMEQQAAVDVLFEAIRDEDHEGRVAVAGNIACSPMTFSEAQRAEAIAVLTSVVLDEDAEPYDRANAAGVLVIEVPGKERTLKKEDERDSRMLSGRATSLEALDELRAIREALDRLANRP